MDQIFEKIGSPEFKDHLNHSYGINRNIIHTLNSNFNRAVKETKEIAPLFKGSTPEKTCINIWNFLKNRIKYVKDPDGYQFIKTPNRFLNEKTGDCKSFSLFSAGILKNIYPNADVFLRYTGYGNLKIPSHVYTILKLNNFAYICDGVYNKALSEKPYKYKEDYQMKIYTLSGFENETINGRKKGRLKSFIKKAGSVVKSGASAVKNIGKGGAKTLALAPLRASFLGIVKINVKNIARKLKEAIEKDPQKVKNFWEKWGGSFDQLKQTVAEGSTKKMIGYVSNDDFDSPQHSDDIGAVATAGAITASAPIILAVLGLIKNIIGEKREKELADTSDIQREAEKSATSTDPDQVAEEKGAGTESGTESGTGTGMSTNTMLMIGAGAVALLLLMKKKK